MQSNNSCPAGEVVLMGRETLSQYFKLMEYCVFHLRALQPSGINIKLVHKS